MISMIPIYSPETAENFVSSEIVAPHMEQVSGLSLATAPLVFGKKINLLQLCRNAETDAAGVTTDVDIVVTYEPTHVNSIKGVYLRVGDLGFIYIEFPTPELNLTENEIPLGDGSNTATGKFMVDLLHRIDLTKVAIQNNEGRSIAGYYTQDEHVILSIAGTFDAVTSELYLDAKISGSPTVMASVNRQPVPVGFEANIYCICSRPQ